MPKPHASQHSVVGNFFNFVAKSWMLLIRLLRTIKMLKYSMLIMEIDYVHIILK